MNLSGSLAKVLVAVLALILVTVLWWLFFFSPKRDAIAAAEADLDNAVLRESTLQGRLAQLREIKDNELSYLFAIGQMESSIPSTPQADAFIEDIAFLAESTGVTLNSLALTPPIADEETGGFEVPVAVSVDGEYFEILGFLYGVEALDRLVRVDGVQLSPIEAVDPPEADIPDDDDESTDVVDEPRQRPNPDRLAADLTMRIFTRAPAAGSQSGGGTVPPGSGETEDGGGEDI